MEAHSSLSTRGIQPYLASGLLHPNMLMLEYYHGAHEPSLIMITESWQFLLKAIWTIFLPTNQENDTSTSHTNSSPGRHSIKAAQSALPTAQQGCSNLDLFQKYFPIWRSGNLETLSHLKSIGFLLWKRSHFWSRNKLEQNLGNSDEGNWERMTGRSKKKQWQTKKERNDISKFSLEQKFWPKIDALFLDLSPVLFLKILLSLDTVVPLFFL